MTASIAQLRRQLESYCDRTVSLREPIRIRRRNGADVMLVGADEYESLVETAHLLGSTRNAKRLLSALAKARRRTTKPMAIEKLRATVGL
jgi:antitoxin YefM